MPLSWLLECTAALRWQIATVSGRVSQKLRCSRLPDKKVPVYSNTGTSEWRSWKLSFVALATNEHWLDVIVFPSTSDELWRRVLDTADVSGVPRWHRTADGCSSQADLLQTPVPTSVVNELRKVRSCLSWKKHRAAHCRHMDPAWWADCRDKHRDRMLADNSWNSLMSTLAGCCLDPIHIICIFSAFNFSLLLLIQESMLSVQPTNHWTAVPTSTAPVLTRTCAFIPSSLIMSSNSAV